MQGTYHLIRAIILPLFFLLACITDISAQDSIHLEDLFVHYKYYARRLSSFRWMQDGQHYTVLRDKKIRQYDLLTGMSDQILLDGRQLDTTVIRGNIEGYTFSQDEQKLLLWTSSEKIYRRSKRALYYVYDRQNKRLQAVSTGQKIRYCTFSPKGDKVAYVYENNLYLYHLTTGERIQITRDGRTNSIINGASDWVYEEEFGITKTFFWSPDGQYVAYLRFDETEVRQFSMLHYSDQSYPEIITFKYPKVGEQNSRVTVHLYSLRDKRSSTLQNADTSYEYIPRVKWTPDSKALCVFQMNRHQNLLHLYLYGVNGTRRLLLTESHQRYVDIHDNLRFLEDGKRFIWTSDRDGYNHLYLYSMEGRLLSQLTRGEEEVTAVYGWDAANEVLYYQLAARDGIERHVMKVNIETGASTVVQDRKGDNAASFTSTFDYYVYTYSNVNTPPVYRVLRRDGAPIRLLEDNAQLLAAVQGIPKSPVQLTQIPGADGTPLNAAMIYPMDFDTSVQYPLLMYVYGGPGSQMVRDKYNSFGQYWWYQMLANEGYCVAIVDNRGTGGRGSAFKKMTYMQLGKYEIADQIHAAKYLGNLSYIDASRIGIWGWSYGGYMSSLAILKGSEVFKMAMAVAPVTNWKWYDSIYTERYMRTEEENPQGYRENSPVYFADRLRGKYLIVHGLADDNVHFQNTAEMVKQLISANKPYESLFYPNRNHSIYGDHARIHLFSKLTDFIHKNL